MKKKFGVGFVVPGGEKAKLNLEYLLEFFQFLECLLLIGLLFSVELAGFGKGGAYFLTVGKV